MWIPGKTNLIGDGISRSLSADEGTTPVTGSNTNLPQVSGISSYLDDSRMENLNYSQSKEFKTPFELLDPASTVQIDQFTHPETRYFERHDEKIVLQTA